MFIRSLLVLLLLLPIWVAQAKEGGGETKTEAKDLPEWVQIQTRVEGLRAKIQLAQDNIDHLLAEKQKLPDNSPRVKELIEELVHQHKELRNLAEEYEKQNSILKYRFPERAASRAKKEEMVEVRSLDEMEKAQTIDSRIERNLKTMREQYGTKPAKPTKAKTIKEPGSAPIEESGVPALRK